MVVQNVLLSCSRGGYTLPFPLWMRFLKFSPSRDLKARSINLVWKRKAEVKRNKIEVWVPYSITEKLNSVQPASCKRRKMSPIPLHHC